MSVPEADLRSISGRIFEVQRFSIHDGPGIRTTVFMKGCPLNCAWCHNPEGIGAEMHLSFLPDRCIGCGYCFRTCAQHAHAMRDDKHVLNREVCKVCGRCTEECYSGALELVGRDATVGEILDEVIRDKPFYDTSGGGMTISGGEPTMQIKFAAALLSEARREGLRCAVETCGYCDYSLLERLRPYVDLWLYDWKESNSERHKEFTGVPNERIRDNLRKLDEAGEVTRLRCPIIPGCNTRRDHLEGIAAIWKESRHMEGVELMPYHRLGEGKRSRLGMGEEDRPRVETPDKAAVGEWVTMLREFGVKVLNEDE